MSFLPVKQNAVEVARIVAQIRAGRALLGWTQQELADRSEISLVTIARIESRVRLPRRKTLDRLIETLCLGGIVFVTDLPSKKLIIEVDSRIFEEISMTSP